MSLTNPNTPVSQQDLQDFYHKLLPYMGGSFGLVATGIDSANLYSTTERVVGQWIDGKPLYQKTFNMTEAFNVNASSSKTITLISSGVDKIINQNGCVAFSTGQTELIPSVLIGFWEMCVRKTSAGLVNFVIANKDSSAKSFSGYSITIQYTKTTDSAVESYGTDTTYSTDEHVVGSWIDGSPVCQAVVQFTPIVSSGNAWHETDADISGLHIGFMISSPVMSVKGSYPAICEIHTNGKLRFMHFRGSDSPTIKGAILQYVKSTS